MYVEIFEIDPLLFKVEAAAWKRCRRRPDARLAYLYLTLSLSIYI